MNPIRFSQQFARRSLNEAANEPFFPMKKPPTKRLTFIDQNTPTDIDWTQVESLYAAVGRKRPFHKAARLRRSFANSYSFCLAMSDREFVGCGRTLSDGQVHGWIHDLAIHPDFQKQGLGTLIFDRLVGQLKGVRYLGLLCTAEEIPFDEKNGFQTGWPAMTKRQKTR